MNRILFEKDEVSTEGIVRLTDNRATHIRDVLHGTVGQVLKTGVVDGLAGTSVIKEVTADAVILHASHSENSLVPWVDIILAVPRPRVLKRLLPQITALGVGRIVLVGAEKVEKSYWGAQCLKPEEYHPLLVEGLMQSGTTILPQIIIAKNFKAFMGGGKFAATFEGQTLRFVAHPAKEGDPSKINFNGASDRPLLAIGPEGGWTDEEVNLLETCGFSRFSLGSRILRTDTATIALLSVFEDRMRASLRGA